MLDDVVMTDSFIFYKSFYESAKELGDKELIADLFMAIMEKSFYGIEPDLKGATKALYILIKPQLEANERKRSNGSKGGRPSKTITKSKPNDNQESNFENQSETKAKPNDNQNENFQNLNKTKTKPNAKNKKPNVNVNVNDNVNVNANENDNVTESPQAAPLRHKYGQYQNVLLSDDDMCKLQSEFPDWKERIERLSEYIASTGKQYKDHLATIRSWSRRDEKESITSRPQRKNNFNRYSKPGGEDEDEKLVRLIAEKQMREMRERRGSCEQQT